jgi:hypothetical protein
MEVVVSDVLAQHPLELVGFVNSRGLVFMDESAEEIPTL